MRSSLDYDFSQYTCGVLIDDFRAWDLSWYPTIDYVVTATAPAASVLVPGVTVTPGSNLKNWPWPLVHEAFSISLRTISFY
jgi:hypothetical protein